MSIVLARRQVFVSTTIVDDFFYFFFDCWLFNALYFGDFLISSQTGVDIPSSSIEEKEKEMKKKKLGGKEDDART